MRGIGRPPARSFVAVFALIATLLLTMPGRGRAVAQTLPDEEVAAAAAALALPQPLPAAEAARLRHVFRLQAMGDLAGAARVAAWLNDGSPLGRAMFGHVLADRYLHPASRPDSAALRDWLARWPDLPDAPAIDRLLRARLPDGDPPPPPLAAAPPLPDPVAEEAEAAPSLHRNPELDRDVHARARDHGAAGVLRLLGRTPGLSADYAAVLRGEAAQILFTLNRDADAIALGAGDARGRATLAGFASGLAAWREGQTETAGTLFAAAWAAPLGSPAQRAAAAFWAGRAARASGDGAAAVLWLRRAAEQGRSFYGLLARRRLGLRRLAPAESGERETSGIADIAAVAATAPGLRAFALLQAGEPARAEAELRLLLPAVAQDRALGRAAMLVAAQAGLTEVAAAFADALAAGGHPRPALPVRLPVLRPAGGFRIDPAMLYGIARTESNFDPAMISSAGALGLLQIMPETAHDLLGRRLTSRAELLDDPAFNLDLGQRYIAFLAVQDQVAGDLIRLLASYNAGLGAFARWAAQIRDQGDPLLFIEAIPVDETRAYVPRVLTWTWLYAARLHLPAPSLDELAAGAWPRYHARETERGEAAWRESTKLAASSP
jgi:soluble lytic murein transglycosylase